MRTRFWFMLLLPLLSISHASAATTLPPPPPQQEHIPPTEAADTAELLKLASALIHRGFANIGPPAPRDAHPKGQGCVKATFTVHDGLAATYRHGVFAMPASYPAWVRLSNGNPQKQSDAVGDGRGMAIKVIGVKGPKLIPDEKFTQDFVMINHPVFFSADARDYLDLQRALFANKLLDFIKAHPRDAQIIQATTSHVTHDMFAETFFSMSPFAFAGRYMKFRALPVRCAHGASIPTYPGAIPNDANYLRARMANDLSKADACYQLQIQLQTDAATQPVEDTTVEWSEKQAPFVTLADMTIPKQTFTSEAQQAFCENLSYTPWHGSVDQRPAGGINRIRLTVYREGSALRHQLDRTQSIEPTGTETFK